MSHKSKYVDAAFQVLDELGGGPISSSTLINLIVEKGLLEKRHYLYHNVLRKVRDSDIFDTSQRGLVSLAVVPTEKIEELEISSKEQCAEETVLAPPLAVGTESL